MSAMEAAGPAITRAYALLPVDLLAQNPAPLPVSGDALARAELKTPEVFRAKHAPKPNFVPRTRKML